MTTYRSDKFTEDMVYAKKVLRQLRLNKGWSVKEGAHRLGLPHRKNLEDYESTAHYGKKEFDLSFLINACRVFGVDLNYFMRPADET